MTTAHRDPRIQQANITAAARALAQAAFKVECLEVEIKDLQQDPPSVKRLSRLYALRFQLSMAEREERRALNSARHAGLVDLRDYPAELEDGYPCTIFLDGPCVAVFF